jgi:L-fuconolactonase
MIDAHFHIWRLDRADYGWLTPELGRIHRDVALDDWRREARPCGVTAGLLVQAAPTEAETRFLLDQAAQAGDVPGVVGWTDLLAPEAAKTIARLAREPKLKGLRPMLQDIADPDWILAPALAPALGAMVEHGLVFDALVKPVHLPRMLELAHRHPDLRIVIDHAAKPDIAHGQWDDWAHGLDLLARDTQAWCKLSGLWTEAAPGADASAMTRHARHVLERFGPDRVLWGSDWPVLELAGSYRAWFDHALALVQPLHRAQVFGGNASVAYRL